MDDVSQYARERWEELARAGVEYSRPFLSLDEDSARRIVDRYGLLGGRRRGDVLCLAGGGGQQSAAFALLGARVTVLDICETQLERDRAAASHYGLRVTTVQGDMRDLSFLPEDSMDVVWHAHSLVFIPDPRPVFDEVCRVLRPGGVYHLHCWNPFSQVVLEAAVMGVDPLAVPYVDGQELLFTDPCWDVRGEDGVVRRVPGPREFRHTLSTVVNGLTTRGLRILGLWEEGQGDAGAEAGTWDQLSAVFPPWLSIWAELDPPCR